MAPDYAALWALLRSRLEGDAEYARDAARRASQGTHVDIDKYHRLSGEADVLARILQAMDEMEGPDWR